jgi:hypothetical protein
LPMQAHPDFAAAVMIYAPNAALLHRWPRVAYVVDFLRKVRTHVRLRPAESPPHEKRHPTSCVKAPSCVCVCESPRLRVCESPPSW